MDGGLYDGRQPARVWLVCVRYVQAEKIYQALVEEVRLAVRSQPPEQAWNQVDELRELPLPVAQRLLRAHLIVDVEIDSVPLHNRSVLIAQRLHSALCPAIGSILEIGRAHV